MELTLVLITAVSVIQPQVGDKVSDAYFRQSHLDTTLTTFKEQTFTRAQIRNLDRVAAITKIVSDREIHFIWTFP